MFDRVRKVFSELVERVKYRSLSDEEIEEIRKDLILKLVEADVALDVSELIAERVAMKLREVRVQRFGEPESAVVDVLRRELERLFSIESINILEECAKACSSRSLYTIVFFGVNGVGKTTTIAKIAYMMKSKGLRPVIAAADTFRAGAQEQLAVHAERIGVPIVKGRYGADPASVVVDAIGFARSRGLCVVLADTAGRLHVDEDLMQELRKVVRVVKPNLKVLVVDSLTGNDAVEQARAFNEGVGVDGVIVAKADADPKGGVVISVVATINKPILYLGVGQSYEDLKPFNSKEFIEQLLRGLD
ncbi:MAG: signal recognition particle-docking protein FtsY [Acidilobaceae archaeon]